MNISIKNKLALIVFFALFAWNTVDAQKKITWEDLEDVEFVEKFVEAVDAYYLFPKFGPSLKALAGKKVSISGFMLVLDTSGDFYVLSKGPFASCFFCGMAGPETIIEVQFKNKSHRKFKMDDKVTLTGTFRLNKDDIEHCNYILEMAEEL
jgi:hypothetical protein